MTIRITARKSNISPHVEVSYSLSELMPPKKLFLTLSQSRRLYLDLDAAIEALIKK